MNYPEDPFDYEAWLRTPPPAQLGTALTTIVAEVTAWTPEKRAEVEALFDAAYTDAYRDAEQQCIDAIDEHPVGESAGCADEITTIDPWAEAIQMRIGRGAACVVQAVAARDHALITDEDFSILTGWWTDASLSLPPRISDTDRAVLVQWWTDNGISHHEFPGLNAEFLAEKAHVSS